jgi:hypothetical protein
MSGFRWKKRPNRVRPEPSLLEAAVKRTTASLDLPPRQGVSKQAMRDEADRLVKEALQRNVVVKEGKTHIAAKCRKCGAPNRISAARGEARVAFICEWCNEEQTTLQAAPAVCWRRSAAPHRA